VRLDKKSTSIALLVALGVRQDGQKVLLAVKKNMGGESEAAWRMGDELQPRFPGGAAIGVPISF
jgi:hypothetical protein